eukprot:264511_1
MSRTNTTWKKVTTKKKKITTKNTFHEHKNASRQKINVTNTFTNRDILSRTYFSIATWCYWTAIIGHKHRFCVTKSNKVTKSCHDWVSRQEIEKHERKNLSRQKKKKA